MCARVGVRRAGGDRRAGARELLAVTAGARVGFQFHCRRVVCAVLVPSMVFFSSKITNMNPPTPHPAAAAETHQWQSTHILMAVCAPVGQTLSTAPQALLNSLVAWTRSSSGFVLRTEHADISAHFALGRSMSALNSSALVRCVGRSFLPPDASTAH